MKIKLVLSGTGAECYVHEINEKQRKKIIDAIDDEILDSDLACKLLNINFIEDDAKIYTGVYPEELIITAFDENENLIFSSDSSFSFSNEPHEGWCQDVEKFGNNKLILQDNVKGDFVIYYLTIESEFNPMLLSPIMLDVAENAQIITGLKYNYIEPTGKEIGEYLSKGLYFYLYP